MFSSDKWFGASPSFYNGVATQSLRFDDDSNSYLNKTLSGSSGNQKTWTYSFWFKHGSRTSLFDFLTANASGDKYFEFTMSSAQKLTFYYHDSTLLLTNMQLRDRSAWYHIAVVHDTTQDDPEDRLKIYVNGVKVTDYETNILNDTNLPEDFDGGVNETGVEHLIGRNQVGNNDLDGYLSDVYLLDGTAVGDTSGVLNEFIEIKNGICIPKKYSGSYGTHGFHFEFKQTGTGTASTSTIGADTSGQTNHYTSNGLDAHDSNLPDSPENNFATINPLIKSGNTFSEGNLKVTTTSSAPAKFVSTIGVTSGKWFMEFRHSGDSNYPFGITSDTQQRDYLGMSDGSTSVAVWGTSSNSNAFVNGSQVSWGGSGTTWSAGDIIGLALNADDSILEVYKNGSSIGSYDYSGLNWSDHFFAGGNYVAGTYSPNFGQDSTFQGAISAGGNADANGIGDFKYAVPSSYIALCSSNLPEPTIGPNADTQADDYFNTFLYTGTNATNRNLALNTFTPDWVWLKSRSGADNHVMIDSTRVTTAAHLNASAVYPNLHTNTTDDEASDSHPKIITNGIQVSQGLYDNNSVTFAVWNWKANGGTTSTNDDGSITSTVQANATAGFSIVTFTGNNTDDATIGHGLGTTPAMIITKNRDDDVHWRVWHKELISGNVLYLASTLGNIVPSGHSNGYIKTVGGSTYSTFKANVDSNGVNGASDNMIAYCFAEVEGYSKFGSYTGNASDDGVFVFTGFNISFLMIKCISATGNFTSWTIYDNKRKTFNDDVGVNSNPLYANKNAGEGERGNGTTDISSNACAIDFLSNGFKPRDNANEINQGDVYIYMAFGSSFKYANAE